MCGASVLTSSYVGINGHNRRNIVRISSSWIFLVLAFRKGAIITLWIIKINSLTGAPKRWAMSRWADEPAHGMPPIRWAKDEPRRVIQWERQLFDAPAVTWIAGSWLCGSLRICCCTCVLCNLFVVILWFVQHGREVSFRFIIPWWYYCYKGDSSETSRTVSKCVQCSVVFCFCQ